MRSRWSASVIARIGLLPIPKGVAEDALEIVGGGGPRREFGDTVLRQRALDQSIEVGFGISDLAETVGHSGHPHDLDQTIGQDLAGIVWSGILDVRAKELCGTEMLVRRRLGGEPEDSRRVQDH